MLFKHRQSQSQQKSQRRTKSKISTQTRRACSQEDEFLGRGNRKTWRGSWGLAWCIGIIRWCIGIRAARIFSLFCEKRKKLKKFYNSKIRLTQRGFILVIMYVIMTFCINICNRISITTDWEVLLMYFIIM